MWKRRHRNRFIIQICNTIGTKIEAAINILNKAITWLIGDEPTYKERMSWTSLRFRSQQRVRKDRSCGQGYNKRKVGTSAWFRTASIVCLVANSGRADAARFDSDSVVIHIDNCASRCITNSLTDFVKPPQKVIGRVKGMGGSNKVAVAAVGTIRWTFDDDDGMSHAFLIPGAPYIPESLARLFSPQHWAQERKDNIPKKGGTWQATFADPCLGAGDISEENPDLTRQTSPRSRQQQDASSSGFSVPVSMISTKTNKSPNHSPPSTRH
jgi:hypothetical protein